MCGGVLYIFNNKQVKVFFPKPNAKLPVRLKNGEFSLLPWGRRKEQTGNLPAGGWARLESIKAGKWDKFFPIPVKIPVKSFMEKDFEGQSHWFNLVNGQVIQGLLATFGQEKRVYVVTITPEQENTIHERWPRIINILV